MLLPRTLPRSLAALGAAAVVAAPASASAQLDGPVVPSVGLSFTVNFGQKVAFGLGLEGRATTIITKGVCNGNQDGVGPYAQVTWLNFSSWRFGAGVQGGGTVAAPFLGVAGEVGWTYHTRYDDEHPGEHGIQLGVVPYAAPLLLSFEVPMRLVIPLSSPVVQPEGIIGGTFAFAPTFGIAQTCAVTGRPLRVDGRLVLPRVVRGGSRPRGHRDLDGATRAALAGAWLEDARTECASVPTFLALARDLAAAGAPASLVARALGAAGDEIRHTLLCAELSADLSGEVAMPELLPPPPPVFADRRDALLVMALEAWSDGCLGEGAAAARAARAAAAAQDPACRAALAAIARDEAGHAELSWAVLAHALATGGSEVGDALAQALGDPAGEPPRGDPDGDADPRARRALGRLDQVAADSVWRETLGRARRRAEALLAAA